MVCRENFHYYLIDSSETDLCWGEKSMSFRFFAANRVDVVNLISVLEEVDCFRVRILFGVLNAFPFYRSGVIVHLHM